MRSYITRIYTKRQISDSPSRHKGSNRRSHTSETPAMAPNHQESAIGSRGSARVQHGDAYLRRTGRRRGGACRCWTFWRRDQTGRLKAGEDGQGEEGKRRDREEIVAGCREKEERERRKRERERESQNRDGDLRAKTGPGREFVLLVVVVVVVLSGLAITGIEQLPPHRRRRSTGRNRTTPDGRVDFGRIGWDGLDCGDGQETASDRDLGEGKLG